MHRIVDNKKAPWSAKKCQINKDGQHLGNTDINRNTKCCNQDGASTIRIVDQTTSEVCGKLNEKGDKFSGNCGYIPKKCRGGPYIYYVLS